MTYLLILFVLALALAPLMHFLPGKRQKKIVRMREYAAVHGLFVEFRDAPTVAGSPVSGRDVIYYGKRLVGKRGSPIAPGAWVANPGGWRSVDRRVPVPGMLGELSAEIIAASVDQSSCGVYWTESTGEEEVERIRVFLERWSAALLG